MGHSPSYNPWLHRFAVLTTCVALLPVTLGALTTSEGAGMAFPDWPTSDGYNMLFYPWLQSTGDEFLEHGHRLAGMLIGLFSMGLVTLVWKYESRLWVTFAGFVVLLSVIAQGILGGLRVLENDPRLAMVHGLFAALVFALMAAVSLFTSRKWLSAEQKNVERDPNSLKPWAIAAAVLILGQYALGGFLRHRGTALFEHMGMAVVVLAVVISLVIASRKTRELWVTRPAWGLLALTVIQISLGLATFITKFGLKAAGWVAVAGTTLQTSIRSGHTIVGMLLLMTAIVIVLRVYRLSHVWNLQHPEQMADRPLTGSSFNRMTMEGGTP
ncbi:MAG: COX15/CtaA family protein [Planctomycetaceae bacterium]|nr:COX15/CtaA family protein [Planctomycetaceae bacterium]